MTCCEHGGNEKESATSTAPLKKNSIALSFLCDYVPSVPTSVFSRRSACILGWTLPSVWECHDGPSPTHARILEVSMWKNVEGCGRMWKDVEGCGRMWKDVEGCGRMWKDVEVWLKFHSVSLSLARGKSRFLLCALESEAPGTVLPACYRLTVLKAFRPPGLSASFDGIQQVSIMSQANNGTAYPPKCCFIWKMRINKSVLGYPIIICYW